MTRSTVCERVNKVFTKICIILRKALCARPHYQNAMKLRYRPLSLGGHVVYIHTLLARPHGAFQSQFKIT